MGTAGFPVLQALEGRVPLAGKDLARVLYQAPGVLFPAVDQATATDIVRRLTQVGLEVESQSTDAPFEPGEGDLDVALELKDPARYTEILKEIVLLLGLDGRTARDLLCRMPCLLVGQVSQATALAIGRRFDPAAAEVVAYEPATAGYDLYVTATAPDLRRRIVDNVRQLLPQGTELPATGALVLEGLDHASVQRMWELIGRRGDAVRVIPQDLARFDLVLDAVPTEARGLAALERLTGAPGKRLSALAGRTPIVLKPGLRKPDAVAAIAGLAEAGVDAHVEVQALQGFRLRVDRCPSTAAAARVVQNLTDTPAATTEAALRTLPATLPGPFVLTRARWLQHELQALGCTVALVRT